MKFLCDGNPTVTGLPHKGWRIRSFDSFFCKLAAEQTAQLLLIWDAMTPMLRHWDEMWNDTFDIKEPLSMNNINMCSFSYIVPNVLKSCTQNELKSCSFGTIYRVWHFVW